MAASDRVIWTAREAFAAAYCWSEFSDPSDRADTPETYWLGITEKARNECRRRGRLRTGIHDAHGRKRVALFALRCPDQARAICSRLNQGESLQAIRAEMRATGA